MSKVSGNTGRLEFFRDDVFLCFFRQTSGDSSVVRTITAPKGKQFLITNIYGNIWITQLTGSGSIVIGLSDVKTSTIDTLRKESIWEYIEQYTNGYIVEFPLSIDVKNKKSKHITFFLEAGGVSSSGIVLVVEGVLVEYDKADIIYNALRYMKNDIY